ncbi:MAG TPA: hypothetical protein VMT54_16215 [Candidatus Cybelea sp.]|nr:hypothetical protein [Candidatus Cybelea sp.]
MNSARSGRSSTSSHRVYLNPGGGELIRCDAIGVDKLIGMAEAADTIEAHQTGPNWLPSTEVRQLTDPLSALCWARPDLVTDPISLRKALTQTISDRLARIRIKTGRHFLAGEIIRSQNGNEQGVLLLVLTRTDITSCDWQRAS